jgi:hypothetical protein
MRITRSRGALSGILLLLLGTWGGLIAFIGPYFNYGYTPDVTWTYNTQRLYLQILPGAAAFLGGLLLLISAHRLQALAGACLAAVAGVWFAVGTVFAPLWHSGSPAEGIPVGTTTTIHVAEQIGVFTGLGVVIAIIAAMAIGRLTAVPGAVPEERVTQPETPVTGGVPTRT